MKRVHFLAVRQDGIIDYLLTPLRINRKPLKMRGYDVRIYYKPSAACLACDILCLPSKVIMARLNDQREQMSETGPVIAFIQSARQYANKIIWFDTSDSTSVTHFELLPHVDLYLKKQLLKDRSLYQKPFYGGRIFSDFYHKQFQITDPDPFEQFYPLDPNLSHKVHLSWNIGLGDMVHSGTRRAYYHRYVADWFPPRYRVSFHATAPKSIQAFLSTSVNLKRPTVAFHRQELVKRLRQILERHNLSGAINGPRMPHKAFRQTLAQTMIMPSPFGWGELGLRDYEAFIYGAALLKPDMTHQETYPDIFVPHHTYCPFQWDYADLEDKICELLESDAHRQQIAQQGQEAYRNSISKSGMAAFCDWFVTQIER